MVTSSTASSSCSAVTVTVWAASQSWSLKVRMVLSRYVRVRDAADGDLHPRPAGSVSSTTV